MARYEHLPIYRAAFDLAVHIEKIVHNFSRYHKYTLGTELRNKSRGSGGVPLLETRTLRLHVPGPLPGAHGSLADQERVLDLLKLEHQTNLVGEWKRSALTSQGRFAGTEGGNQLRRRLGRLALCRESILRTDRIIAARRRLARA